MMKCLVALTLGTMLHAAPAVAADATPTPTILELLEATDDVGRGDASVAVIRMEVRTSRYERNMKLQAWSRGKEKSLIKILEPAKEAGTSTLKVDDNMWNYLPKVDRTMKIPAGMMSGSWMGSHFTNDDLVREVRLADDYDHTVEQTPADNSDNAYVIQLVPHDDVPVVWGKVVVKVRADKIPLEVGYYDDQGKLARTMRFDEPKDFGLGPMPSIMTLIPAQNPAEFTRIVYESVDFKAEVPEEMFSLQALRN